MSPILRLALALAAGVAPLSAQVVSPLGATLGWTVRVWHAEGGEHGRLQGRLVSSGRDTLTLQVGGAGALRSVAQSSVLRIEEQVPTALPDRVIAGMGWGFMTGLAAGAAVGVLGAMGGGDYGAALIPLAALSGAVMGIIPGGLIGTICCDRWRDVPLATGAQP